MYEFVLFAGFVFGLQVSFIYYFFTVYAIDGDGVCVCLHVYLCAQSCMRRHVCDYTQNDYTYMIVHMRERVHAHGAAL